VPASDADRTGIGFPPYVIYIGGFLSGVVLELLAPIDALPLPIALAAGIAGFAAWLALDGAAMVRFRQAGTSMEVTTPVAALVTSGPYRFSRNPMYLGMALLYVGLALGVGVIWALALLPVVLVIVDRYVIPPEERFLEARFGHEYRIYKARVRRWF
jgi:protein-S-isoprenylcysteine O-methyltransferase Ste14